MTSKKVTTRKFDVRNNTDALERVREGFFQRGESVSSWSRKRGYNHRVVYSILGGNLRCASGICHRIAVDLGLKEAGHVPETAPALSQIDS